VSTAAFRQELSAERFGRPATGPGNVSFGSKPPVSRGRLNDGKVPSPATQATQILKRSDTPVTMPGNVSSVSSSAVPDHRRVNCSGTAPAYSRTTLVRMKLPAPRCFVIGRSWPIAPLAASGRKVGFRESCRSIVRRNNPSSTHCCPPRPCPVNDGSVTTAVIAGLENTTARMP